MTVDGTMLAEIYGWFTEGFDTADLKEARASARVAERLAACVLILAARHCLTASSLDEQVSLLGSIRLPSMTANGRRRPGCCCCSRLGPSFVPNGRRGRITRKSRSTG